MNKSPDDSVTDIDHPDLPLVTVTSVQPATTPPSLLWRIIRKIRFIPLVMLFGATIGVVALYFQPPGLQKLMGILNLEPGGGTKSPIAIPANPRPSADEANVPALPDQRKIIGLGKLLPEGDIRTVAPPFGAGDARIEKLFVDEGDSVKVDDQLATLDNEQNIRAIIENAQSTVSVRRASLNQIKSSVRLSLDGTRASLARAKSALENAQTDFERTDALLKRGFTTKAIHQQKRSARDQASGEVERLKATLARFAAASVDEQPDVIVAARNLDAAISDYNRAKGDLAKSRILAPVSGVILNIYAREGERPGAKGILDIGNINKMTAEVEIYQTEISAVTIGAQVELSAHALSRSLKGKVTKIGLEVGSQKLVDSSPAANTDARVVLVTVALDKASSEAAKRYTNLQVVARIDVQAAN